MIYDLINHLLKNKISPNQYYLLLCFRDKKSAVLINPHLEARILQTDGWITENYHLTARANGLLNEVESMFGSKAIQQRKYILNDDDLANIVKYRELFPRMELPSGALARVNIKELEKKFSWFLTNYRFDWDTILKATEQYIARFEAKGYLYMQNSSFFISREDKQKNITSALATACDNLLESDPEPASSEVSKYNLI